MKTKKNPGQKEFSYPELKRIDCSLYPFNDTPRQDIAFWLRKSKENLTGWILQLTDIAKEDEVKYCKTIKSLNLYLKDKDNTISESIEVQIDIANYLKSFVRSNDRDELKRLINLLSQQQTIYNNNQRTSNALLKEISADLKKITKAITDPKRLTPFFMELKKDISLN